MEVLITAGPTREPIDEVRYVSNRSSGRLGVALARSAAEAGHGVTLLLGPGIRRPTHAGLTVHVYESAADLEGLLGEHFPACELLLMAAAVADYRPARPMTGKLKRDPDQPLMLTMEPIPDLVAACGKTKRPGQKVVAFALDDTAHLDAQAADKLRRKHADAIVANPLQTMDGEHIDATLHLAGGQRFTPGPLTKEDFAAWLVGQLSE